MSDIKVTSQTVVIEKNKGLTHALKKHVESLQNSVLSDGNISAQEWNATMDKLAELNKKRIENGKTPIFRGETDKSKAGWHTSFVVDPNQKVEFSEDEMKELYKAMGVTLTEADKAEEKPDEKEVPDENPVEKKGDEEKVSPKTKEKTEEKEESKTPVTNKTDNKEENNKAEEPQKSENKGFLQNLFYNDDKFSWKKVGIAALIGIGVIFTGGKLLKLLKRAPKGTTAVANGVSGVSNTGKVTKKSGFLSWFKRNKTKPQQNPPATPSTQTKKSGFITWFKKKFASKPNPASAPQPNPAAAP